jgi:GH25 family lysozyme M1 (1,4-beta-N-acetylmuramidase)
MSEPEQDQIESGETHIVHTLPDEVQPDEAQPEPGTKPRPKAFSLAIASMAIITYALVLILAFYVIYSANSATLQNLSKRQQMLSFEYMFSSGHALENSQLIYSDTFFIDKTIISEMPGVKIGIDVSEHQGTIDWQAVAGNGIDFAFVRVGARGYTAGGLITDTQFEANIDGARDAGLLVGAYYFSQAINVDEAVEEAEFVIRLLNGRPLDYPIAYDFETVSDSQARGNHVSYQQMIDNARAFCDRIQAAGYSVMLYGNGRDLLRYGYEFLAEYEIWYAEFNVTIPRTRPFEYTIWQFTSLGKINGINNNVDLSLHFTGTDQKQLPGYVVY